MPCYDGHEQDPSTVVTGAALGMRSDEQVNASGSSWAMFLELRQPCRLLETTCGLASGSESYILSDSRPFQEGHIFQSHSPALSTLPARRSKWSAPCESLRSEPSTLMRFLSKPTRHLQLPSFETLGIAIPSPKSVPRTVTEERFKQVS